MKKVLEIKFNLFNLEIHFGSISKYFLFLNNSFFWGVCVVLERAQENLHFIYGSWKRELYLSGYISLYVKRIISNDNMIPIYMGGVVSKVKYRIKDGRRVR